MTDAWRTLKPGPRALYVELKRRFNGSNNGEIFLSHRDAAKAINVTKNTVGPYFDELESRGFILKVTGGYLGPDGCGKAAVWALDEERTADGKAAMKRFMTWKTQKPVPKIDSARPKKEDNLVPDKQAERKTVPKTGTETA